VRPYQGAHRRCRKGDDILARFASRGGAPAHAADADESDVELVVAELPAASVTRRRPKSQCRPGSLLGKVRRVVRHVMEKPSLCGHGRMAISQEVKSVASS